MDINLLDFNISIGKNKPRTIANPEHSCPFCDVDHLTDIIDTDGDIILLKNKYNVLEPSNQLVLIESNQCHTDIPDYTPEHLHRLFRFAMKHWLAMIYSEEYDYVIFFKNFGPMSGGTISHPHMQLIGLPEIDPELIMDDAGFEGIPVNEENGVAINVATRPRIGFTELNIIVNEDACLMTPNQIDTMADYIQVGIRFLRNFYSNQTNNGTFSYNIFFYMQNDQPRATLLPRFPTSPLFVGYNIHLKPTNLEEVAKILKAMF